MPENAVAEAQGATFAIAAERDMASRLIREEEDPIGLIAFALHRRAFLDWQDAFLAAERRPPGDGEIRLFLLGEQAERRLQAYRERAMLIAPASEETVAPPVPAQPMPARKPLRTWFWPWGISPGFVVENPDQPINWKGLILRLALLALAVIVTALALRFLVVRA
jgi:hypothetical protein